MVYILGCWLPKWLQIEREWTQEDWEFIYEHLRQIEKWKVNRAGGLGYCYEQTSGLPKV